MSTRSVASALDAADSFVHDVVRAFARDLTIDAALPKDDWVDRAVQAGVLAPMVDTLVRSGVDLPPSVAGVRLRSATRRMRSIADLVAVDDALRQRGVAWVLLKGPVLTSVVYERTGVRDFADLDVLVPPERVDDAVRSLVAVGASITDTDWRRINRDRTAELALEMPAGSLVDLHWDLANLRSVRDAYRFPTVQMLDRRVVRPFPAGARTIELPTLDDLDLAVHVMFHGCLSGGHQLRWMLDAQQCLRWLARLGHGPQELAARAEALRAAAPVRAMLDRVADHLDVAAEPWGAAVTGAPVWSRTLRTLGRRASPSAPSSGRRSARNVFAATRPTTWRSMRAMGATLQDVWRYRGTERPQPERVPVTVDDDGYREWVAFAAGRRG